MSKTNVAVGDRVTFTGNHCPPMANSAIRTALGQGDPVWRADGTWSVTVTVQPDAYAYIPYRAGVACVNQFIYLQVFTVTVTTPYRLSVTPSGLIAPGTTITVRPAGNPICVGSDQIRAAISPSPPTFFPWPEPTPSNWPVPVQLAGAVNLDGSWVMPLQLPNTLRRGTYWVVVACANDHSDQPGNLFQPSPIQVS